MTNMTKEEVRFQVAFSCIQGVLEAKHGIIGEIVPKVAVKESLRIADEFVKRWFGEYLKEEKEQKPAEWSEEDETNWQKYIRQVELQYSKCPNVVLWDDINWLKSVHDKLKSLRPQPHWKPNECTLSLVKKVANGEMLTHMEQMAMKTLYNDLKKLK